jgi:TetR/AcrR family transcriptional repressor of nem operon
MANAEPGQPGTATRILDVAERLVQVRGYNGFSYADVANELKMTKAALHYHFASKAELGEALIERYSLRFFEALAAVEERTPDAPLRLHGYAGLYAQVLRDHRMCLCGMMVADYETLSPPMQDAVVRYIQDNRQWLSGVLSQGRDVGTLVFDGSPGDVASMIFGALEGAMLIARLQGDVSGFESSVERLLASLLPLARSSARSAS